MPNSIKYDKLCFSHFACVHTIPAQTYPTLYAAENGVTKASTYFSKLLERKLASKLNTLCYSILRGRIKGEKCALFSI